MNQSIKLVGSALFALTLAACSQDDSQDSASVARDIKDSTSEAQEESMMGSAAKGMLDDATAMAKDAAGEAMEDATEAAKEMAGNAMQQASAVAGDMADETMADGMKSVQEYLGDAVKDSDESATDKVKNVLDGLKSG